MKNLYKGQDDLYYVISVTSEEDPDTPILVSELDALKIEFYTTGSASVTYDKTDVTPEGILYVNADRLLELPDGALRVRFFIALPDSGFEDEKYDQTSERLTGYFLKTLPAPAPAQEG